MAGNVVKYTINMGGNVSGLFNLGEATDRVDG